jgi:hypothetical protein
MKKTQFLSVATACFALLGVMQPANAWAKSVGDKIKDSIDSAAESFKKGVDKLGDDFNAIQDYLDHYHWRGLVEDKVTDGPATLEYLTLNGHSKAIAVTPGQDIAAEVIATLDPKKVDTLSFYRIVVGIPGEGPQAVIGNEIGFAAGRSEERFFLKAPARPGIYHVCFRLVNTPLESTAREAWKDDKGYEPDTRSAIGIIVVK